MLNVVHTSSGGFVITTIGATIVKVKVINVAMILFGDK
jgi:hypothetical protein